MRNERLRILVEIALCAALFVVLKYLKLLEMPSGGSVSLAMLPIIVIALLRGPVPGLVCGLLCGTISLLLGSDLYSAPQALLDYPVTYLLVGLSGFLAPAFRAALDKSRTITALAWILVATAVGVLGRFVASVLSGVLFFAQYAPEGQSPWLYSAGYNLSYLLPTGALTAVAAVIVIPILARTILHKK
ncbi:MAG: energy-coupled thiamine transporter ThiT [Actinomycetes bacterium]|jgi:thiamine transporter|nr:energy-coupled thiamine transporter ThiT [Actinomycetes bacterium]